MQQTMHQYDTACRIFGISLVAGGPTSTESSEKFPCGFAPQTRGQRKDS